MTDDEARVHEKKRSVCDAQRICICICGSIIGAMDELCKALTREIVQQVYETTGRSKDAAMASLIELLGGEMGTDCTLTTAATDAC